MPHVYLLCPLAPSLLLPGTLKWQAFKFLPLPSICRKVCSFIGQHGWLDGSPSYTYTYTGLTHTQAYTLWGILGIRERLYCRQHINKMFHFSLSAVCLKGAPALHRSRSTLSLHRRLPHFSPTIFICVVLQRERKQSRFAPEEHQRWEKRIEAGKCF